MRMMLLPGVIYRGIGALFVATGFRGRAYVDSTAFQPGLAGCGRLHRAGVRAWGLP